MTDRGPGAAGFVLSVTYRDLKRFATRTAVGVLLLVTPAVAITYLLSQRSTSVYLSESTVLAPLYSLDIDALGDTPTASLPLAPGAYGAALGGLDVLEDALRRLGVDTGDAAATAAAAAQLRADASYRFEESRRSTLLMIGAHASTPERAAAKANALTDALVAWDDARAHEEAATRVQTLATQLAGLEAQLTELRALGNRASTPQLNSVSLLAADVRSELALERSLAVAARGNLEVLQAAARATQLRPSPLVNAAVVAALGTLLVMLTVLALAWRDRRVNGEDGLSSVTGLPLLASVAGAATTELSYLKAHVDRALPDGGTVLVVGVTPDDDSERLAQDLSERYDLPGALTFVNSSPSLLASAAAVSRTAVYDVVVLVADPYRSRRDELREAVTWLRRADANVLGVVAAPHRGAQPGRGSSRSGGARRARQAPSRPTQRRPVAGDERPNTGLGPR